MKPATKRTLWRTLVLLFLFPVATLAGYFILLLIWLTLSDPIGPINR